MLHVAIDARLPDSGQGGVLQVLRVLGMSFRDSSIPKFRRTWIVYRGTTWWSESIPAGDSVLHVDPPFGGLALRVAKRFPRFVSSMYPILRRIQRDIPSFDDQLRAAGVEVVHLPFQDGFITELPFVYNPHDLQHRYFPENFSQSQIHHRENIWRRRADGARIVMAASFSVARDLMTHWSIDEARIRVLPIPPPERSVPAALSGGTAVRPGDFCIYPAVYWPHKNHLRLIAAIRLLQEQHIFFDVVLTGAEAGNYPTIRQAASELPDPSRVIFAGHVSNADLSWLIANSRFMVVPSLFEAMSLTVWDGQRLGTPVACSSVDPFPDQVGDTALVFDSFDSRSIADAMLRLWSDEPLRRLLTARARDRVLDLTDRNFGLAMYGVYCEAIGTPPPAESKASEERLRAVINGSISSA